MNTPDFSHPNKFLRNAGFGALLLVMALYYTIMQWFAADIPFCDEYIVALQWLDTSNQIEGMNEKFLHLFSQANEHRHFTFTLAVLTDYNLFGTINFKRLLWAGNIGLVLMLYLVNLLNQTDRRNPWIVLPVAFLLFAPQNEITNWPLVAFAAILQTSLIIASLYLLSRSGWLNLAAAVMLAVIATFSFGNGMFTFAVGFLVLALKKPSPPIAWLIWSVVMALAIFLYFYTYTFTEESGSLTNALRNPVPIIQFFLTFFGTIMIRTLHVNLYWVTLAGLIPIVGLGHLILFKWHEVKKQPVALSFLLFILISAALTAVTRQSFGVTGATAPRYILLQALFLAVLMLLYMNIYGLQFRWLLPIFLCTTMLLYGVRLVYGIFALNRHQNHLKEIILAYKTDPEEIKTAGPDPLEIKRILDRSIATGVYTPPRVTGKFRSSKPFTPSIKRMVPETVKFNLEQFGYDQNILQISGWAFSEDHHQADLTAGIVLQSGNDTIVLPALPAERRDVRRHFKKTFPGLQLNTGFSISANLSRYALPGGTYRIGICILKEKEIVALKYTAKRIEISPPGGGFNKKTQ